MIKISCFDVIGCLLTVSSVPPTPVSKHCQRSPFYRTRCTLNCGDLGTDIESCGARFLQFGTSPLTNLKGQASLQILWHTRHAWGICTLPVVSTAGFRSGPLACCQLPLAHGRWVCVALCDYLWVKRPCMANTILIATIQHQVEVSPTTFFDPFFESHTTWKQCTLWCIHLFVLAHFTQRRDASSFEVVDEATHALP